LYYDISQIYMDMPKKRNSRSESDEELERKIGTGDGEEMSDQVELGSRGIGDGETGIVELDGAWTRDVAITVVDEEVISI
jgi:hypothetical protein